MIAILAIFLAVLIYAVQYYVAAAVNSTRDKIVTGRVYGVQLSIEARYNSLRADWLPSVAGVVLCNAIFCYATVRLSQTAVVAPDAEMIVISSAVVPGLVAAAWMQGGIFDYLTIAKSLKGQRP